jgi:hypothetical protein
MSWPALSVKVGVMMLFLRRHPAVRTSDCTKSAVKFRMTYTDLILQRNVIKKCFFPDLYSEFDLEPLFYCGLTGNVLRTNAVLTI